MREFEVALIVRRTAEDGARAVFHQHEVGDVDRKLASRIERMPRRAGRCRTPFFSAVSIASSEVPIRLHSSMNSAISGASRQRARKRMIGRRAR